MTIPSLFMSTSAKGKGIESNWLSTCVYSRIKCHPEGKASVMKHKI